MNKRLPGAHKSMVSPTLERNLLLATILLAAFALRMGAIADIPPGLSHDEAYNGVTALEVLAGEHRVFFEINKGIEPLIIYLEAGAFYLWGVRPVSLRLVNVFCGLLTVALIYPLTVRWFNRRVALLAMAGVAISFWAIFVSRLTLRAVTLPPLLILTIYFLSHALKPNQSLRSGFIFFTLTGLAAGATMYTYLSSRFIPLLLGAMVGYQLLRGRVRRWQWPGLLLLGIIGTTLFLPLAGYYWENAASFTRRADQVTTMPHLLNGEIGPTLNSTLRTLGMFTVHGDETDRYNLDGRPVFDWINGFIFYGGVIVLLLRWRRPAGREPAAWLFIWGFFMLLPDFITDDSPHFLRTIGALPVVYIIWAVGLERLRQGLAQGLAGRGRPFSPFKGLAWGGAISGGVVGALLFFTTLHTVHDYFNRWATAPGARAIYGADIAAIADRLTQETGGNFPAISAEYYRDLDPFRLQLHFQGQAPFAVWFDGRQSLAFPPPESGLEPIYFFAASAPAADPWLPFLQPAPTGMDGAYAAYHLAGQAAVGRAWAETFPGENSLNVNINNDLILLSYRVLGDLVSGGKFKVLLGWQALRPLPPDSDYTFLVRLRDRQGHIWAEADGNGYDPGDWQPGVRALQLLILRLPGDLPPRTFRLTLEVVDRRQGSALPATTGDSVVLLETLTARLANKPRSPAPTRLPNPTAVTTTVPHPGVEPQLALRGYRLNKRSFHPVDTLSMTFHWQVLDQPDYNYRLEFSLSDPAAAPRQPPVYRWPPLEPATGEWPTGEWPTGYWVQDRLDLPVASDVPAGRFTLQGRWLGREPDRAGRLPFALGDIRIEAP